MLRALPVFAALLFAPAAQAAGPAVQAHRGGSVLNGVPAFAEETLPAFQNAAHNLNAVLELDAKLTKDNVPVVFHDDTLDRTTACTGLVVDRTLNELASCPADVLGAPGNGLKTAPAKPPVPIATLAEVLAFAKTEGIGINLEIKNYPTDDDYDPSSAFATRVMQTVLDSKIPARQVIIQSFTTENLDVAQRMMPDAEFALLALGGFEEGALTGAAARGYDWVSPSWPVSKDYVDRAHSMKLRVVPYTINKRADVLDAAAAGVDALITDDPLMALKALDTKAADVKVAALSTKLRRVRRAGRLAVRVSSNERATVDLTAKLGRKVLGRGHARFAKAGSQRVVIRLTRRGRRALADRRRAKVALVAKALDVALNRSTARMTVALR